MQACNKITRLFLTVAMLGAVPVDAQTMVCGPNGCTRVASPVRTVARVVAAPVVRTYQAVATYRGAVVSRRYAGQAVASYGSTGGYATYAPAVRSYGSYGSCGSTGVYTQSFGSSGGRVEIAPVSSPAVEATPPAAAVPANEDGASVDDGDETEVVSTVPASGAGAIVSVVPASVGSVVSVVPVSSTLAML